MEKRILIKEDQEKFKEIAKDLKQFMPFLNEIKASFEALEIGEFTNEDFKKIVLLGPKNYMEIYIQNLNNQLDKLGVTISVIRQNAIKDHKNVIERFKKAVDDAKRFYPEIYSANRPKLTIKFISYEKGLFVICKEDKEMILETFCRIYLDDDQEIEILETAKELQKNFNKYLDILNSSGINVFDKFLSLNHIFIINEEGKVEIKMEGVKSISTWKKRHEAHILERNERSKKRIDAQKAQSLQTKVD